MKHLSALLTAILIFAAFVLTGCVTPKDVQLHTPDLNKIADGQYDGSYQIFPVSVTARVTVRSHKIVSVEILKHFNGQGKSGEAVTNRIVQAQTPDVDGISGATHSSKTIQKAVEIALDSAAARAK